MEFPKTPSNVPLKELGGVFGGAWIWHLAIETQNNLKTQKQHPHRPTSGENASQHRVVWRDWRDQMIGGPNQHYGLCPFCGADIERPGGTTGRAPATCGSDQCKRAHNTQKRAVNRRNRSYKSRPLGGFGTLAWTRVHEYGDSVENEYGDTHRNGWEYFGRASRPYDFNTFDTHYNLGHTV